MKQEEFEKGEAMFFKKLDVGLAKLSEGEMAMLLEVNDLKVLVDISVMERFAKAVLGAIACLEEGEGK